MTNKIEKLYKYGYGDRVLIGNIRKDSIDGRWYLLEEQSMCEDWVDKRIRDKKIVDYSPFETSDILVFIVIILALIIIMIGLRWLLK